MSLLLLFQAPAGGDPTGGLNATEAADTVSSAATIAVTATLSATGGSDTLSSTATIPQPVTATLSAAEDGDTVSSTATTPRVGGGGRRKELRYRRVSDRELGIGILPEPPTEPTTAAIQVAEIKAAALGAAADAAFDNAALTARVDQVERVLDQRARRNRAVALALLLAD